MSKVWFITGASRGLGRAFAKEAVSRGNKVIVSMRKIDADDTFLQNPNVFPVKMDVTNKQEVDAAVAAAVNRFGRIDVLVNNAGYGLFGAFEEISDEELRRLFETCFFGVANVTRAVIPYMRKQMSGRIISMSSRAGVIGEAGSSAYVAAKFAVVGLSESLSEELSDFNIQSMVVCPGPFRTDFRDDKSRKEAAVCMPEYEGKLGHRAKDFVRDNNGTQNGDPDKAAKLICDFVDAEKMPVKLMLGGSCCDAVKAHLQAGLEEIDSYYDLSNKTAFEE